MKKILTITLLILGCAINLDISTKKSEKWCLEKCKQYDYPELIIAPMKIAGYESPKCICMTNCMYLDSSYCLISLKK